MQRARGPMRAFCHDQRAGGLLQPPRQRRMVLVRMADGDMRHLASPKGPHQSLKMRLVLRSGIDHADGAVPDNIAVGAMEGERRGVVDRHPLDAWRHIDGLAMGGLEGKFELRKIIAHAPL